MQTAEAKPAQIGPSLPLGSYVGDYTDPWYGTIKVRQAGNGLAIDFPHSSGMEGPLTHYQYDTFKTNPKLNWVEPAYVTFSIDPERQGRPGDDEAGLAHSGFQLGLPGPAVHARSRAVTKNSWPGTTKFPASPRGTPVNQKPSVSVPVTARLATGVKRGALEPTP